MASHACVDQLFVVAAHRLRNNLSLDLSSESSDSFNKYLNTYLMPAVFEYLFVKFVCLIFLCGVSVNCHKCISRIDAL